LYRTGTLKTNISKTVWDRGLVTIERTNRKWGTGSRMVS